MGSVRRIVSDVLRGMAAKSLIGGFWQDEQGNLIEGYEEDNELWKEHGMCPIDDAWRDEQGNPLKNYAGEEE